MDVSTRARDLHRAARTMRDADLLDLSESSGEARRLQPLVVDVYPGDLGGKPDWATLAELGPPWHGAIIKATEGVHYAPEWFGVNWKALRTVAGVRYARDWFRGCYHFLKFACSGAAQAEFYVRAVERSGGWDRGDLWPIVDVELGGDSNTNRHASPQQVVDCTCAFADRARELVGRQIMLYGNGAMRDLRITSRMRCDWIWVPRYTPTLPSVIYERAGWSRDRLFAWQYCGDGEGSLAGYPMTVPGFGRVDISVLIPPCALGDELSWLREKLHPTEVCREP